VPFFSLEKKKLHEEKKIRLNKNKTPLY